MEISVVLLVDSSTSNLEGAVHSILLQSFKDFELIIINNEGINQFRNLIKDFNDNRITYLELNEDHTASLNYALKQVKGKYIVRMYPEDRMHIDRLRVQYKLMERETNIDFCASWVEFFGKDVRRGQIGSGQSGFIENALLQLLRGNCFFRSTMMMSNTFIKKNDLTYKPYLFAEDYKFWVDASLAKARFFIEPQILQYDNFSNHLFSTNNAEAENTLLKIRDEIVEHIINDLPDKRMFYQCYNCLKTLSNAGHISRTNVYLQMYDLLKSIII